MLKLGPADEWFTPGRFALCLALAVAAAFPGILLGSTTFVVRDFGMFSFPVAYFHRQSFWRGELPLWNPFNNCGLPFLAQWNTLTLYPLSLIYLLLPLSRSLSFFCLVHLFWGGLGMYFLAQDWTRHRLAAALAGVIFSFNGLSLNFLMWPSHVATFSWLPWVVWLAQAAWREGGKHLVWAILAAAMQMLAGGPETIGITWLILLVLACGDWIARNGPRGIMILRFTGLGFLVGLVCAAQLLPFLELLAHSQRDSGYSASTHDWSMPFWGWANFLVPLFRTSPSAQGVLLPNGQYWASSYYAGIGTVALVAVAVRRVTHWRVRALAVLLLLGLVLALGEGTLLYRGLRCFLPGLGLVRYPVKAVILTLALAPPLAAYGLAALTGDRPRAGRFELGCAAVILLLTGAIVAVDWRSAIPEDAWRATWQSGLSRAAFLILIALVTAALLCAHGLWRTLCGGLLVLVFWLDLLTHTPTQNPGVDSAVYRPGWTRAQLQPNLQPRLGESRAMITPAALEILRYNALPGLAETYLRNRRAIRANCNLLDELPQVDGFFSLTPRESYRLTRLPYDQREHEFPALLDFWAVSQITARGTTAEWVRRPTAMPILSAGQRPVFADDATAFAAFAQTNLDLRQIVFLPLEARGEVSATRQVGARVLATQFANQKVFIQVEAPAPSVVVISQTDYPAWEAYVDDQPAKLWRANYAFQALQVPAGSHRVLLIYQDRKFLAGIVISALGLLACLSLWLRAHSRTPMTSRSTGHALPG